MLNIHQIALKLDKRRSASSKWTTLHCCLASTILKKTTGGWTVNGLTVVTALFTICWPIFFAHNTVTQ
jgi:hypothetical protein